MVEHRWHHKSMEHRFQRIVDVGSRERTLVWCRKCAGWDSGKRMGKRPWDVCKPRHSTLVCQLKRVEQGFRLERRKNGKTEGVYVQD